MLETSTEKIETLIDSFISYLEEISDTKEKLYSDYQSSHCFSIEITEYKHVMIMFVADLHIGSIYTNYQKVIEFWKFILEKDNVYVILNGDLIDNFDLPLTRYISGINSQVITPELQRELFLKFLNALIAKKKLLACVLGNHEAFSPQFPYFKLIQNIPVSPNRMLLNLKVSFQRYKIALVHKSRFNSILNPLHSNWRELTTMYPDADIIVTSHTHLPAFSVIPYPDNGKYIERVLIKTGTLKIDPYTTSFFSHPPDLNLAIPSVVLSPIGREITPFLNYRDAYRFMLLSYP